MSHSDKRGATLPKVATVALLLRNDNKNYVIANVVKQSRRLEYARLISHSDLYCGVNVPDETGKMSHSDKRGATLPKVATVALLLRNDNKNYVIANVVKQSRRLEYARLISRPDLYCGVNVSDETGKTSRLSKACKTAR